MLEHPTVYAAWQAPFVAQKVAPFLRANKVQSIRRVLDIGCGPGTNARLFEQAEYLGIDLEDRYVGDATRVYGPKFRQGDAGDLNVSDFGSVDCLFVNSLTHHLSDATLDRLLARTDLVSAGGALHLIDLYLPGQGLPRWLALADRGEYPRSLGALEQRITRWWNVEIQETFSLKMAGISLWSMVYFRAVPRSHECV